MQNQLEGDLATPDFMSFSNSDFSQRSDLSEEFSNDVTLNPDLYNTSKGGEGKKKKKSKKVSKPEKYYPGEGKKSEGKHKSKSHFRKSETAGKPKKPCNCGAGVK